MRVRTRPCSRSTDDGRALAGEEEILPWLDEAFEERPDAAAHREKALDKAGLPE